MTSPDDKLTSEQLAYACAAVEGVDRGAFSPISLFMREADIMQRFGPLYVVHVRVPGNARPHAWAEGRGTCPLDACMRAYLKSRRAIASNSRPVATLPEQSNRVE